MATKRKAAVKPAARKPASKGPAARKVAAVKPATKKAAAKRPPAMKAPRGPLARASAEALRLAGVGSDAVARATGKAWDQWLAILDRAGAATMPHQAIAALLAGRFGVPSWWSQMVAVGYEQARGLRKPHQKADGFAASASRTVAAGIDRLYGAWADPALRTLWLGGAPIEVKRSTGGKSMRIAWKAGGSSVDVNFRPAGPGRSRVQVEHGKLADERARAAQKNFWDEALDRLKAMLEKAA
jgi:uncharacterized protein YndB with AHSA1/START domain